MNYLKLVITFLFSFAFLTNTNAQDEKNPIAIGLGGNIIDFYNTSEFNTQVDDLLGSDDWNIFFPRITAEKYIKNGISIQVGLSVNEINTFNTKDDVNYLYWSIDPIAKYSLKNIIEKKGWFDPYVYAGLSYVNSNKNGAAMPNLGLGFNVWFNENVGLNFHTGTKANIGFDVNTHYQTSLGLVLKYGNSDSDGDGVSDDIDTCPEIAGLEKFKGCPDTDGDGVKDSDDSCPNIAGSILLNGCPDTDADGVADKDDNCPKKIGSPSNNGCPEKDTDNDGVIDKIDKCPNTVGTASNNGCPEEIITKEAKEEISFTAKSILFNSGKSTFKTGVTNQLNTIARIMNKYPKANFAIEGYTDSVGADELNLKLSDLRAKAVKNYLVTKGVNTSRLEAKCYGEQNPVDTNSTRSGRANNRRVEIKVTN